MNTTSGSSSPRIGPVAVPPGREQGTSGLAQLWWDEVESVVTVAEPVVEPVSFPSEREGFLQREIVRFPQGPG